MRFSRFAIGAVIFVLVPAALYVPVSSSQDRAQPTRLPDAALKTGLTFKHFIGATGDYLLPENMSGGVALFDYDQDGDLDVFFTQGAMLGTTEDPREALYPPPTDQWPQHRLYRNELIPTGRLLFRDVTLAAGLTVTNYGMGVAVGDIDNNGYPDLYVTGIERNVLLHNLGNGTFRDITNTAGVKGSDWSTSASFVDFDNDGDLDLYVARYVHFSTSVRNVCRDSAGRRDYCNPASYVPLASMLFRNDGGLRFTDVTTPSGIGGAVGRGLGVISTDADGDGLMDIFVANDGTPNHLWMNKGNGRFADEAVDRGVAYGGDGQTEAGMGVAAADIDDDGDEDLFVTHLEREQHRLYINLGDGTFEDRTARSGLWTARFTGFGTGWFDYDNDGFLDLFVANGAVHIVDTQPRILYPYMQPNQLFRSIGVGKFVEESLPEDDSRLGVHRGAAFGDIDNDGDIDIVVANNNGHARLLLNASAPSQQWLSVRLVGRGSNRMGIGSQVGVSRSGHRTLWRRARTDGSYLSSNDVRVQFGLKKTPGPVDVYVQWPSGKAEIWERVKTGIVLVLTEGSGNSVPNKNIQGHSRP